jgi:hypothetical protein
MAIIATIVGGAVVFVFALWSAKLSRDRARFIASQGRNDVRQPGVTQRASRDEDLNKVNAAGREMAATGGKN